MPVWEKSPSFKVIACFVWSSEQFTGLAEWKTPPAPGMNRVKEYRLLSGQINGNILNSAYANAFNLVPLRSPVIILNNLLCHGRTTNQLHDK